MITFDYKHTIEILGSVTQNYPLLPHLLSGCLRISSGLSVSLSGTIPESAGPWFLDIAGASDKALALRDVLLGVSLLPST